MGPAVLQAAKDAKKDVTIEVVNSQTGKTAYSWTFSGGSLKTYTYAMTVSGNAVPSFNSKAFAATVKRLGNKYYVTV